MTLDLTLSPLYRINGQEIASLPGLVAITPPQNAARGREKDRLIVYLLLTGNSTFSTSDYMQVAKDAANIFYKTSGSLTSALRTAADLVNNTLLERNMTTSKTGHYAVAWLTLAALRDTQCTLALSGPMHAYWFGQNDMRHIHEPATSGKGLGTNQTTNVHYSQVTLSAGDRLLFFGRAPDAWNSTLSDPSNASLDAMRRRLSTLTHEDLNAILMQATDGTGVLNLLNATPESKADKKEETAPSLASQPSPQLVHPQEAVSTPEVSPAIAPAAHVVQASAYAIPPQHEETPRPNPLDSLPHTQSAASRDFPASIPRIQPVSTESVNIENDLPALEAEEPLVEESVVAPVQIAQPRPPRPPSARRRQTAKALAIGIQSTRRLSEILAEKFKIFLPRLLPNTEASEPVAPSNAAMIFMAILIPLMVVTMLSVVYLRYGRSQQYETYLAQAQQKQAQALTLSNDVEERQAWENVLLSVDIAESHRTTSETITLRQQAEANLDELLGITRMQYNPAFSSNLGIDISRMAASETDLFMLNAATGEVLRASPSNNGRGFQVDTTFNCKPGVYGNYTVGPLVDILTLPVLNTINATLLGIDAAGNLLYCAPGQLAQATPLPPPDTNWGRVTAFTMDGGNLYVLDFILARGMGLYRQRWHFR